MTGVGSPSSLVVFRGSGAIAGGSQGFSSSGDWLRGTDSTYGFITLLGYTEKELEAPSLIHPPRPRSAEQAAQAICGRYTVTR